MPAITPDVIAEMDKYRIVDTGSHDMEKRFVGSVKSEILQSDPLQLAITTSA